MFIILFTNIIVISVCILLCDFKEYFPWYFIVCDFHGYLLFHPRVISLCIWRCDFSAYFTVCDFHGYFCACDFIVYFTVCNFLEYFTVYFTVCAFAVCDFSVYSTVPGSASRCAEPVVATNAYCWRGNLSSSSESE